VFDERLLAWAVPEPANFYDVVVDDVEDANFGRMSSVYFCTAIAHTRFEDGERFVARVVPGVGSAGSVGFVQFSNDGIRHVLIRIKAHRHHAAVAVACENDGVAILHVVGNLRKLVAQVGNGADVCVSREFLCERLLTPSYVRYFIIIMLTEQRRLTLVVITTL